MNKKNITDDWIEIAKEVPDTDIEVILTNGKNVFCGKHKSSRKLGGVWSHTFSRMDFGEIREVGFITHWKRLPKPPINKKTE